MHNNALVTGGMGFIGRQVVSLLLQEGWRVLILDNFETSEQDPSFNVKIQPINPGEMLEALPSGTAGLIRGDIRTMNSELLNRTLVNISHVFHLAALPRVEPSIKDPIKYHNSNVNATLRLFDLCRKQPNIKKIIFSSSSSVYGDPEIAPTNEDARMNPMSPYALHKLIGEQYLDLFAQIYNLNSVSLRYFNVYGEGQPKKGSYVPVMGIFFRQKKNNQPLTITGDGTQTRDFVNVRDVARANLLAATTSLPEGHHKINVASGKNYSLNQIAEQISDNILHIAPRHEPHTTLADISKAKELLDWEPEIDLIDWIESNKPK
mgnify:CR=1 FL=1|tara:strand:- start:30816 stop:31775 length:960 start_codon:yes stop_codon:yes gene_type:complete